MHVWLRVLTQVPEEQVDGLAQLVLDEQVPPAWLWHTPPLQTSPVEHAVVAEQLAPSDAVVPVDVVRRRKKYMRKRITATITVATMAITTALVTRRCSSLGSMTGPDDGTYTWEDEDLSEKLLLLVGGPRPCE
jgi:hypothetical protein